MLKKLKFIQSSTLLVIVIFFILFFIPFFWFKPGELALGGDSSRLYFYNTLAYLKSISLYMIDPEGIGKITPAQYLLPFLLFLLGIKMIVQTPHMLISTIDGVKLAGSFLFIYLIVTEILHDSMRLKTKIAYTASGIIAGLFYTFSPGVTEDMKYALLVHNQVFLNPLMFYLLLKFLKKRNFLYVWLALLVTCLFTSNFALQTPPPLFAFYPLAIIFLLFYISFCLKKEIYWKGIIIGVLFFLGLQLFQIIPGILNAFDSASIINSRIFDNASSLSYFDAIRGGLGKVSAFLFYPSSLRQLRWWGALFPFLMIWGLVLNKKKNNVLFLTFIFFFISLLFVSANITNLWVSIYRLLFYIPGFSMFRNFSGQWQYLYAFFFALLLGQSIAILFLHMKTKYIVTILGIVILAFGFGSWDFIGGQIVNATIVTTNVSTVVKMDPKYEETLNYISSLSSSGKMLLLPLNDFAYQIVHGLNNGAYAGSSTVAYIAGMPSYTGYLSLGPFGDEFLKLAKEKNYPALRQLLGILDIKYIFHNADPKVYDNTFATFPYGTTKEYLPKTQKNMAVFAQAISDRKIYQNKNYIVYELDNQTYPTDFYIPQTLHVVSERNKKGSQNVSFFEDENSNKPIGYVYTTECKSLWSRDACRVGSSISLSSAPIIRYKKINSIKYILEVSNIDKPFILIQSNAYHQAWEVFSTKESYSNEASVTNPLLNNKTFETLSLSPIPKQRHILINGYANAWLILPSDFKSQSRTLIIEMVDQRVAYICFFISAAIFFIFIGWGIYLLIRQYSSLTR